MNAASLKRKQFLEVMDRYLEALALKKLNLAPLAAECKITFNGEERKLGDNFLWANALYIPQRQVFIDTVSGNAVLFGIATNEWQNFQGLEPPPSEREGEIKPTYDYPFYGITMIRIHITDGRIDEVEEIFEDKRYPFLRVPYSEIRLPELIFDIPIPTDERMTRQELIEVVDTYWDCISKKRPAEDLPLHPEAKRVENGMCCTHNNGTFRSEFRKPSFTWKTPKNRRFTPIVDEVRGVVFSMQGFVETETSNPGNKNPYILDVFKIENGLIRFLMAFWRKDMKELGW